MNKLIKKHKERQELLRKIQEIVKDITKSPEVLDKLLDLIKRYGK